MIVYLRTTKVRRYKGSACGYAHIILHRELIIIDFDSDVICICFAEQVFCSRLGAHSAAPQRRAYARRAAQRRVHWTWYLHNVFTESTDRKSVPAKANRRGTRTRNALLTVHNPSSIFLCPWHRVCAASPWLPRPAFFSTNRSVRQVLSLAPETSPSPTPGPEVCLAAASTVSGLPSQSASGETFATKLQFTYFLWSLWFSLWNSRSRPPCPTDEILPRCEPTRTILIGSSPFKIFLHLFRF